MRGAEGLVRQRAGAPGEETGRPGSPGRFGSRARRHRGLVWVGAAVVVLCSAGFAAVLVEVGQKVPVLAVTRAVPAGKTITADDLREVRLAEGDAGGYLVSAARRGTVVGKVAVVPLVPGQLLSPREFGNRAQFPPAGQALVPFAVERGGVPAGLAAGERVAILPGPSAAGVTAQSTDGSSGAGASAEAVVGTVIEVAPAGATGEAAGSVVTVLLDTAAAGRAAQIEKPRLVVLSPTGREVP